MSIEGVPEGWKIKRLEFMESGRNYIGSNGKVFKSVESIHVFRPLVERDVKIIDMSQCKVDIEYRNSDQENKNCWSIFECNALEDAIFVNESDIRVRQDHYFGWKGGECPLPEGVMIKAYFRGIDIQNGLTREFEWSHSVHFIDTDAELIGFEVIGTGEGYAYAHDIGGEG